MKNSDAQHISKKHHLAFRVELNFTGNPSQVQLQAAVRGIDGGEFGWTDARLHSEADKALSSSSATAIVPASQLGRKKRLVHGFKALCI